MDKKKWQFVLRRLRHEECFGEKEKTHVKNRNHSLEYNHQKQAGIWIRKRIYHKNDAQ